MKKIFILLLISGLLVGCSTAQLMNRVSLGMTKDEAIKSIRREPSTTKVNSNGTEILEYILYNTMTCSYEQYWVVLKDGKVAWFGRALEFGNGRVVPY